jgi:hypothetical protein
MVSSGDAGSLRISSSDASVGELTLPLSAAQVLVRVLQEVARREAVMRELVAETERVHIPGQTEHRFRAKPNTDSGAI